MPSNRAICLTFAVLVACGEPTDGLEVTPSTVGEPPGALPVDGEIAHSLDTSNDTVYPADPIPDRPQTGPLGPSVIYVNFTGGPLVQAGCPMDTNSKTNCFSTLNQPSQSYGGWGEYWGRQMILNHLRMQFEGYNVQVTDARPSSGDYSMAVLTHTAINAAMGGTDASWFRGSAVKVDCGNVNRNNVVVVIDQTNGRANFADRVELAGKLLAHEMGHAFGLEHTTWEFDLMHTPIDNGVGWVYAQKVPNQGQCLNEFSNQDGPHRLAQWVGTAPLPARRRLNGAPAVVSMTQGHYDVFARASNGEIIHKWYWGGWSGWESLGGFATSDPAVVSWADGRIDLFVRGWDKALHHKWYTSSGGWSHWESLGGTLTSAPSAASPAPGILDVYVRGTDNQVHRKAFWNGWGGWEWVGGGWIIRGAPAAVSWGPGHLDFFVRGTDDQMWHRYWTGNGWSNFESLGGVLYSSPGAMAVTQGIIDTYHRGSDSAIWRKAYWNGWGGYESMGGVVSSAPGVASWGVGRHDIFVRGPDYTLQHKFYDGYWHNWYAL